MNLNKHQILYGFKGFIFTLIIITTLLTIQFVSVYIEDFSKELIDKRIIFKFFTLSFLSFIVITLPVSVLVMTSVYYRKSFQFQRFTLSHSILMSLLFSIAGFIWISFISPKIKLHMVSLIYDVQLKAPEEPLIRSDINIFEKMAISKSYFQLGEMLDSLETNNLSYENKGLKLFGISKIKEVQISRAKMTCFPLLIFIVFFLGIFLGVLNQINNLVIFIISIYLSFFPLNYFLSNYFEKLSMKSNLLPIYGQLLNVSIWAGITIAIGFYMKLYSGKK